MIIFPDTTGTNPATGLPWASGDTYTDAGTSYEYTLTTVTPPVWVGTGIGGSDASYLRLDATNSPLTGVLSTTSDILPTTDISADLGGTNLRWANIYTGDLHFNNEGSGGNDIDGTTGNWTLQEGNENMYFINNKSGAKFRVVMESVG